MPKDRSLIKNEADVDKIVIGYLKHELVESILEKFQENGQRDTVRHLIYRKFIGTLKDFVGKCISKCICESFHPLKKTDLMEDQNN